MTVRSVNLETMCGISSAIPKTGLPEFAFAGRSNVGKSSLINALINRKGYAHTSSEPGKTQTINFYNISSSCYFVDLPGYGYAKVSRTEKEKWGRMVERYLRQSCQLCQVFQLVDIRHEPGENDIQMYDWFCAYGFRPTVIATKLDKIGRNQAGRQLKLIRTALGMQAEDTLIAFSATTKQGRDEIWTFIDDRLADLRLS